MPDYAGLLIVHFRETHLQPYRDLIVGDVLEVIRGSGLREGDRMGVATVTAFDDAGVPELDVHFHGGVDDAR